MTYKGKKITAPTLEMIQEHIQRKHMPADPVWVYEHYKKRNWKTLRGRPFKTLEIMIGAVNGLFCHGHSPMSKPKFTYEEQLKDPRWNAFREFVFAVRGKKCEHCGKENHLQVHHTKYVGGRKAWEYTCKEVKVLCRDCHALLHNKPT